MHVSNPIEIVAASDGPAFAVTAKPVGAAVEEVSHETEGDAVIGGSKRNLLAFLLGRTNLDELQVSGRHQFGASFHRAFPGP